MFLLLKKMNLMIKIVTTTKTIVKKVITKSNTKNDEPTIIQSIEETHNSEI